MASGFQAELGVRLIHVNGLPRSKVRYNLQHKRREVASVLLETVVSLSKVKLNPDFNNLL